MSLSLVLASLGGAIATSFAGIYEVIITDIIDLATVDRSYPAVRPRVKVPSPWLEEGRAEFQKTILDRIKAFWELQTEAEIAAWEFHSIGVSFLLRPGAFFNFSGRSRKNKRNRLDLGLR
jgi:hypothetical protein